MKYAKLLCVVLGLMLAGLGCKKQEPTQAQQSAPQAEKEPTAALEPAPQAEKEPAEALEPAKQTKPGSPTRPATVESTKEPAKQTTATNPAERPKPPEPADPKAALLQAVDGGDLDKVEAAIAAGANVNATSTGGFTNLHLALIRGREEVAALLIANGADTHAKMTNGTTPLHFAAMGGCKRIVEFLIDDGSDINAQDQMQGTPLHFAALPGHVEIIELLVAKGADLTATNPRGLTALAIAKQRGHTEIYELLSPDGTQKSDELLTTQASLERFERMKEQVNRRAFIKKTILGSAAVTSAVSLEERALLAAMRKPNKPSADSVKGLPAGKIGPVKISRVICGGNLIGGYAHSRDLLYASSLLKHYFTDEKILETLQICEENGVNTIITNTGSAPLLKKYWDERGGRIQWIAQCVEKTDDPTADAKKAIDGGAVGAFLIGNVGDLWASLPVAAGTT